MIVLALLLAVDDPGETKAQAEQHAVRMHRLFDLDHDGSVTYDEARLGGLRIVKPDATIADLAAIPDSPHARASFDRADTNHDGRLSLAEEVAAADRNFDEADTNHDGLLSVAENAVYAMHAAQEGVEDAERVPHPPCMPGAMCDTNRARTATKKGGPLRDRP